MLAISRRGGESVRIGAGPEAVTVTVVEVRGSIVRLAIDAPREVTIVRTEVPLRVVAS